MDIKHEKNLSLDEFLACKELYEKTTGRFWMPTTEDEGQALWIASFEKAKSYFESK